MSLTIGKTKIGSPVVLGPMAGVTDLPFRVLCREQGAGLVCTEMVSAKAILYRNRNTMALMRTDAREHPVALQLFGSEPDVVAEAAARIEELPFEIYDFNMGCPMPKIVNNHEGAALLQDLPLAEKIIAAMTSRVKKPVTVKIRRGFAPGEDVAVEAALRLEAAGAAAITVHGRTREQYYAGRADWDCIRRVKEAVKIPVIGNGDVDSAEAALRMFRETGVDAVMIARAARGNPWIFREVRTILEKGADEDPGISPVACTESKDGRPSPLERLLMVRRHADMLIGEKGEYIGVREMRKHISWYTNGLPHAATIRRRINEAETKEEMFQIVEDYFSDKSAWIRA